MRVEISQSGTTTGHELCDGHYSLGGDDVDDLRVPGLPARWLMLHVAEGRLVLTGSTALILDDALVPAQTPKELGPGESVRLSEGVALRLSTAEQPGPPGTVAMLKDLLGQPLVPSSGRAAVLTCLTGLDTGVRFALSDEPSEVGRAESAHIRLRDRAVSRRHARLRRENGHYLIEDLGTPNGVFVNGHRIASPFQLSDDAVIELGRTLLRFRDAQQPAADTSAGPPKKEGERTANSPAPEESLEPRERRDDSSQTAAAVDATPALAVARLLSDNVRRGWAARAFGPPSRQAEWALFSAGALLTVLGGGVAWLLCSST